MRGAAVRFSGGYGAEARVNCLGGCCTRLNLPLGLGLLLYCRACTRVLGKTRCGSRGGSSFRELPRWDASPAVAAVAAVADMGAVGTVWTVAVMVPVAMLEAVATVVALEAVAAVAVVAEVVAVRAATAVLLTWDTQCGMEM